MSGDPEQGPVFRLGDLSVAIAAGQVGDGRAARIVVVDCRNRRELVRLHPREAYALGVILTAKARAAGAPTVEPTEPEGGE